MTETATVLVLDPVEVSEASGPGEQAQAKAPAAAQEAPGARGTRVAKNFVIAMGGQLLIWAATSAVFIMLPRYLGDDNVGRLTFATSVTTFFTAIMMFGSDTYITRAIAREPDLAPHIAFNAILTRLPFMGLSAALIVAFMYAGHFDGTTRLVVYVTALNLVASAAGMSVGSAFQGLERMTPIFANGILEKVIALVLTVAALVFMHQGLMAYALVALFASVATTMTLVIQFWRTVGFSFRFDPAMAKQLYIGGGPFFLWRVSLIVYGTIDVTMLQLMTSDDVVGWYGTAYRFIGVSAFVPFAVALALLPSLSSAKAAEFRALAQRSLDFVVMLAIPISALLFVTAGELIQFLRYPAEFNNTVVPLRILSLHIPLTAVSMITGTVLIARDKESTRTRIAIFACALNPALNLMAIPYFQHAYGNGAIGASITTVITEIFMFTVILLRVAPNTFAWSNVSHGLRCVAAGVVMGAVMWFLAPFGFLPMVAVGGVIYLTAIIGFGATSVSQLLEMPRILRQRGISPVEPES